LTRRGAAEADPWLRAEALFDVLPWLAAALACVLLVAWGFPMGHDWSFELLRVSEYRSALLAGQWPPFWAGNLYGGYGSPVFLYYAPLFSALAASLSWLAGALSRGSTWALIAITLASVPIAHGFLAALLESAGLRDRAAARIGTVFFVTQPYLLGDKWVRNADAEFLGLCLLPLALTGVALAARAPRRAFACVSAGIAAVVLAHNLTALVAAAFALGLTVLLYGRGTRGTWGVVLGGLAAGLLLSLFFWLPALALTGLVRPEELLRGKFDFHRQFQGLEAVFGYGRFFSAGLFTPAVLAGALAAAFAFPAQRRLLLGLAGLGTGLVALTNALTQAIWELVPGLPLFQFPWRMLGPLALVASALAAVLTALGLRGRAPRLRGLAELLVTVLLVANALPIALQYRALPAELAPRLAALADPGAVRQSFESVTVLDEYLPRAADPQIWRSDRPFDGPVIAAIGAVRWETALDTGTRIELTTHSPEAARLRLARWYFPGWQVDVDGVPASAQATPAGTLELDVPAGDAHVRAWLEPPPLRRICTLVSAAALAFWAAGLWLAGRRARSSIASLP
jgi:hypothetical protein